MLYEQYKSYLAVAKELKMDRHTVKKLVTRYREKQLDGFEDLSRRPKHSPNRIREEIEQEVVELRKKTNYGAVRLAMILKRRGVKISPTTIKKILKRHGLSKSHKVRSVHGYKRTPHFWDDFMPLECFQADVKDVMDEKSLPPEVYEIFRAKKLPRYQFTAIDIVTRMRFISYGFEKSCINGMNFIFLVIAWLRTFGIMQRLFFQTDWGEEFGGKSLRKLARIEKMFDKFNAELLRIKKGAPQENAYVERVHKSDDSEFYIPRLRGVESVDEFLKLAHRWNVFYNLERPHSGKNMNGNTPFEKAKSLLPTLNTRIALMPPLLLDSLIKDKLFTWDYGENLRDLYNSG